MDAMSGASCCGLWGGDGEGLGVLREGVEAEGGFGDDGEGAEAAGEEFAEVVAGDVFDDLAAGAGDGAVGEDEGHADDEVAEAAVAVAEGAGVVGGEDAADGGAFGPEGVEGYELAVLCEGLLECCQVQPAWTVQVRSCQGCSMTRLRRVRSRWMFVLVGLPQDCFVLPPVGVTVRRVFVGVAEDLGDLLGVGGGDVMVVVLLTDVFGAGDGG